MPDEDKKTKQPRSHDPRSHDPRSHDPSSHDPRSQDPRSHDPRSHDPRSHDLGVLTHSDGAGGARMVDVGSKQHSTRYARAVATVRLSAKGVEVLAQKKAEKGNVLATAQLAGIMAAKRTSELIPLCHSLPLSQVALSLELDESKASVTIEARCRTFAQTGVEMEALTAVAVAGLTVYDMLKSVDRAMRITDIRLLEKSGGASGSWNLD